MTFPARNAALPPYHITREPAPSTGTPPAPSEASSPFQVPIAAMPPSLFTRNRRVELADTWSRLSVVCAAEEEGAAASNAAASAEQRTKIFMASLTAVANVEDR